MDQFKVALSADDEVVAEVVREHAPRFAAHGYELTQVSLEKSNVLRAFPAFRFENKRTQLRIIVSFNASEQGSSGGFIVLIVSPKNVKLDVEDYLVLHGREELPDLFRRYLHNALLGIQRRPSPRS